MALCVILIVNDSLTQIYLSQVGWKKIMYIQVYIKYIMSQMVIQMDVPWQKHKQNKTKITCYSNCFVSWLGYKLQLFETTS